MPVDTKKFKEIACSHLPGELLSVSINCLYHIIGSNAKKGKFYSTLTWQMPFKKVVFFVAVDLR